MSSASPGSPFPKPALPAEHKNSQDVVNSLHEQMNEALAAEDIQDATNRHWDVFDMIHKNKSLLIDLFQASPEKMEERMRQYEEAMMRSKYMEQPNVSDDGADESKKHYTTFKEIVSDTQLLLKRILEDAFNVKKKSDDDNNKEDDTNNKKRIKREVKLEDIDIVIPKHFFSLDQELKGYYEDFLSQAKMLEMLTTKKGGGQFKELCRQFIWQLELTYLDPKSSNIPKELYSSIVGSCLLYLLSESNTYYVDMSSSNDDDWKVFCMEDPDYQSADKMGDNSDEEIQARMQTNLQKVSIYKRSTLGELHKMAIADVVHGNDFDKAHIDQLFDDMIQQMLKQKEIQRVDMSGIMMYILRGEEGNEYESISLSIQEKGEVYKQLYKKICWGSLGSAEMNDMRSKLSEQQFIFLDRFLTQCMESGKANISKEGGGKKRGAIHLKPEDFLLLIAEEYLEEKFLAGSEWKDLFSIMDFVNEFGQRMNIRVTTEDIKKKFEENLVNLLIRNEKVEPLSVNGGVIYRLKRVGQVESKGLIEKIINKNGFFVEGKRVYLPFFLEIGEILAERRYPERGELGDLERMHKWLYSELNRRFSDLQVPREAIRVIHVIIKKWMEIGLLSKEDEKLLSAEERKQRMYRLLEEVLEENSEDAEKMAKTSALLESVLAAAQKKVEALEVAKGIANELTKDEYTEDSWLALETALVLPDATNAEIETKTTEINNAVSGLVFAGKEELDAAIARASGLDEDGYTPETRLVLQTALGLPERTNEEIVLKVTEIENAISELEYAGEAALEAARVKAAALIKDDYTEDSWLALETALRLTTGTNTEVVAKTTAINNAISGLVYAGKEGLDTATMTASGLTEIDYTAGTRSILESALLLPDITNAEIVAKTIAVNDAMNGLITISAANGLASAKTRASGLIQSDYTPGTWASLQSTLAGAQRTDEEIVRKTTAINNAISSLIFEGQAALDTASGTARGLRQNEYTAGTWLVLQNALRLPDATNAAVLAKTTAINNAMRGLITVREYEAERNRIVNAMLNNDKSPLHKEKRDVIRGDFTAIVIALLNDLDDTMSYAFATVADWIEKAEEDGVAEGLYDVYLYIQGKIRAFTVVEPEKTQYKNALQSIQKMFDYIYETKAYTVMHRKYEQYISSARGPDLDILKEFNEIYLRYPLESDITGEFKNICKTFLPEKYGNNMILVRDDNDAYNLQAATSEKMFFKVLEEMARRELARHTTGLVPLASSSVPARRPGERSLVERSDFHVYRGIANNPLEEYNTEEKIRANLVDLLSRGLERLFPEIYLPDVTVEQLLRGLGYANDAKGNPRAVTAEELKQIIVNKIDKWFEYADTAIVERFLEILFNMGLVMKNDAGNPPVYIRIPRRGGLKAYRSSKERGEKKNYVLENESEAKAKLGKEIEESFGLLSRGKKMAKYMTELVMYFYDKGELTGEYLITYKRLDDKTLLKVCRLLEERGLFKVRIDNTSGEIYLTPNFRSARHALSLIRENAESWQDEMIVGLKSIRRSLGRSLNNAGENIMDRVYGKTRFREEELLVFEYPEWRNLNGNPLSILEDQPELMNRAASDAYTIIEQMSKMPVLDHAVAGRLTGLLMDIPSMGIANIYEIIELCRYYKVKLPPSISRLKTLFDKQLQKGVKQHLNVKANRLDGCTGTVAQCLGVAQKIEVVNELSRRRPLIITSEQLAMLDKILTQEIDLIKISEGMYVELTAALAANLKLEFEDRKEQLEALFAAKMKVFLEFVIQKNGYILYDRDPYGDDVITAAENSIKKVRKMGIDELVKLDKNSGKYKRRSDAERRKRAEDMRYQREYRRLLDSSKLTTKVDITDRQEKVKIGFDSIEIDVGQGKISGTKHPNSAGFTIAIRRENVNHPDKMIEAILADSSEGLNQKQKIYLIWEYIRIFISHMYGGVDGKGGMGNIRGEWGGKKYILRVEDGNVELIFEGETDAFFSEKEFKQRLFDGRLDDMPEHLTTVMVMFRQSQNAIEQKAKTFFDAKYSDTIISLKNIDKAILKEIEVSHLVATVPISDKKKALRLVLKDGKEADTLMSLRFGMICKSPCLVRIDGEIYELESRTPSEDDGNQKQYKIKKKRKSIGAYMQENKTHVSREVMIQYTQDMVQNYLSHPEFSDQRRNRKVYFNYGGRRYECSIDANSELVVNQINTPSGNKDFMYMADEEYRAIENSRMSAQDKEKARMQLGKKYPGVLIDRASLEDYKFAMYDSREGIVTKHSKKQVVWTDRPPSGIALDMSLSDAEVFRGDPEFQMRLLRYILDSMRVKKK